VEASEKHRQAFRLEINEPAVVSLEDGARKMSVTLVDLSEGGCRVRSQLCLPYSQIVFNWKGPTKELKLYGEMVGARITPRKGTEFNVKFDMPQVEKDALVSELVEIQRRIAFKPVEPSAPPETDKIGRAKRKAYRAPCKFAVVYKDKEKMHDVPGVASDLSIGGMLLVVPESLAEGATITVEFTLPTEAVDLGGEQREVVEQTPFGPRKVKKLVPVRPFEAVTTQAKIVKRLGAMPEGTAYGVQFLSLSAFTSEEIARFVHAFQLTQVRRVADARAGG
jgi:c-di-GMP-binding flagellar brake protein YcgR